MMQIIPSIHPIGALISTSFLAILTGTLWWMLHPRAFVTRAAARARQSVFSIKKILVPTVGLPYTERSVELACRLGEAQKAEILLTYVLEVPRTMPLGIPLPEAEEEANNALKRATEIVLLHGLPTRKIVQRARMAGEDIARSAKELNVDMIVVGIQTEEGKGGGNPLSKTADAILKHSSCEVIIDKLP